MIIKYLSLLCLFFGAGVLHSQTDSLTLHLGAFVDSYFMYDFNNLPANIASHPFISPLRHNEFNVNLAQIEVKISGQNIHGTLSLQSGTSVKANYSGEINNRELSQLIHEAWAGYQITYNLWIDAGIYPAPYGFEGWLSRDNKVYSPSLVANFSPYYQTGIRATWQLSESVNAGLNIINGWQNITENNNDKAVGLTLGWSPSSAASLTYNNFIGNEQPAGSPSAIRFYNNLCTRISATDDLQFDLTTDYGMQNKQAWYGAALIGKMQLTEKFAFALRGEYYKDEHQIIYLTGTANGFDGFGASVNADIKATKELLWRTEFRFLQCKDTIFQSHEGLKNTDNFIVTSLGLSL